MTASAKARNAVSAFLSALTSALGFVLTPIIRRRTLAQLDELDDRMLKDIGFTRFDVDAMRQLW
jgi:uncharacterized protein YjiS (DUF1127 family)